MCFVAFELENIATRGLFFSYLNAFSNIALRAMPTFLVDALLIGVLQTAGSATDDHSSEYNITERLCPVSELSNNMAT